MKLFKVSQTVNNGYDTYDAIIVAAEDEADARQVKPLNIWSYDKDWVRSVDSLIVEYLGEAKQETMRGIILASFNAG